MHAVHAEHTVHDTRAVRATHAVHAVLRRFAVLVGMSAQLNAMGVISFFASSLGSKLVSGHASSSLI